MVRVVIVFLILTTLGNVLSSRLKLSKKVLEPKKSSCFKKKKNGFRLLVTTSVFFHVFLYSFLIFTVFIVFIGTHSTLGNYFVVNRTTNIRQSLVKDKQT